MVEVDEATLPGTAAGRSPPTRTRTGPRAGSCPTPTTPDDEFPPPGVCDSEQLRAQLHAAGMNYLGADFGYVDHRHRLGPLRRPLWIDTDGDGLLDTGEAGIP